MAGMQNWLITDSNVVVSQLLSIMDKST